MFNFMRKLSSVISPTLAAIFLYSSTIGVAQASTQPLNMPYIMGHKQSGPDRATAAPLFDHDTDSLYSPSKAQLIERDFRGNVGLKALKLFGTADYKVSVECHVNGTWERRDSWSDLDLSAHDANWHTYALAKPLQTDKVRIYLIPLTKTPKGIAEIAFVSDKDTSHASNRVVADEGIKNGRTLQYALHDTTKRTKKPVDSTFTFTTAYAPSHITKAELSYEVEGVSGGASVIRAVNDELAQGGLLLQAVNGTNTRKISVTEEISPQWLKAGENRVRFIAHERGEIPQPYRISNVRLSLTTTNGSSLSKAPRLVAYAPQKSLSYREYAYLRGFVETQESGIAKITVDGKEVAENFGAFEALVKVKGAKDVKVKATLQDGTVLSEKVAVNTTLSLFQAKSVQLSSNGVLYLTGKKQTAQTTKVLATAESQTEVSLRDATLKIEKEALRTSKEIRVSTLDQRDLPPLDQGMVNVTKEGLGYRFLPHGTKFDKENALELAYDESKLPKGMSAKDVKTYFFDEDTGRWLPLPKVAAASGVVTSKTDHFTDMINAVIKTPDAPQAKAYGATQIKDLKVANPGAKINLIEAPKASSKGDAQLNYPIEIPAGRHGMAPQLSVNYSSGASNSWMGLGWNLSTPSIGIDTRWGVPRYDEEDETETYTIAGQQLTPLAHRGAAVDRTAEKRFYPRVEGEFNKVIRHGDSPWTYWWEVTTKNGTKSYYGGTPSSGVIQEAVLTAKKNGHENIAHWALVQSIDTYGNTVTYSYEKFEDSGVGDGNVNLPHRVKGYQLYLKNINYTGFNEESGAYDVTFTRDRDFKDEPYTRRNDVTIDARLGFKRVTADLLKKIEVKFKDETIRSYEFVYTKGAFEKTLLEMIEQYDANGDLFNTHTFEYFDEVREGTRYNPFKSAATGWTTNSTASAVDEDFAVVPQIPGIPTPDAGTETPVITPPETVEGTVSSYEDSALVDSVSEKLKGILNALTHVNEHSRLGRDIDNMLTKGNSLFHPSGANNGFAHAKVSVTDSTDDELSQTARDGALDLIYPSGDDVASDYIRVWEAPFDGRVFIDAPVALVENGENEDADGVRVSVQHQNQELWSTTIAADDFRVQRPNGTSNLSVKKGEHILFRVQTLSNSINDIVSWSPVITYKDEPKDAYTANKLPLYNYSFVDEFIPQAAPVELPFSGVVRITGDLVKPVISDDATFTLIKLSASQEQSKVWEQSYNASQETEVQPEVSEIEVAEGDKLFAIISTQSNVDFRAISWNPTVKYLTIQKSFIDRVVLGDTELDAFRGEISPHYTFHQALKESSGWEAPDDATISVKPVVPEIFTGANTINFTLKSDGKLLVNQIITTQDLLSSTYEPLSLDITKGERVYFEYYYLGDSLVTDPSYWRPFVSTADAQQIDVEAPGLYELPINNGDIFYRGWGEFTYAASEDERTAPVAFENLRNSSAAFAVEVATTSSTDTQDGVSSETLQTNVTTSSQTSAANTVEDTAFTMQAAPSSAAPSSAYNAAENFKMHPSALSGAESEDATVHISVTVGPSGKNISKENTIGGKIGFAQSETEGVRTLVDIDGDSLPDQVVMQGSGLKYRKNLSHAGVTSFAAEWKDIPGASKYHHSKSKSINGGFEAHFGAFAGINFSKNTSTTDTYFSDVNGDGLIDIVSQGVVLYNRIDENGNPSFSTSSIATPNPILNPGSISADDGWIKKQSDEELAELAQKNPLHDTIRRWKAPVSGTISINAPVTLIKEDSIARGQYGEKADGVIVSIQHNADVLWDKKIKHDDYLTKTPSNVSAVNVEEGDRIYFRVHSIDDGAYDNVNWAPIITYTDRTPRQDANGLEDFTYDANKSFLLPGYMVTMPIDGTISITNMFKKPATSDDVIVRFVKLDDKGRVVEVLMEENTGRDAQERSIALPNPSFDVLSRENYRFEIISDTNVDWAKISWKQKIEYTAAVDENINLYDNGKSQLVLNTRANPHPYAKVYNYSVPFIPEANVTSAQITPMLLNSLIENGNVVFSIKRNAALLAKQTIQFEDGLPVEPILSFPVDLVQGEGIYLEYHTNDTAVASLLRDNNASVEIKYEDNTTQAFQESFTSIRHIAGVHSVQTEELYGPMYRYWGQFVYNAKDSDKNIDPDNYTGLKPIIESELKLDDALINAKKLDDNTFQNSTENSIENDLNDNGYDPAKSIFVIMMAKGDTDLWYGMDPSTNITPTTISSSRLGLKHIQEDNLFPTSTGVSAPIRGINKITESVAKSFSISAGAGFGKSLQDIDYLTDFIDMNGDRYPDIVGNEQLQYTSMSGTLESRITNIGKIPTTAKSESTTLSLGAFPAGKPDDSGGKPIVQASVTDPSAGLGIPSGSIALTTDKTDNTLKDINGDGLPDRVYDDGNVQLNLGYRFGGVEQWGFSSVHEGESIPLSGGGGAGITWGNYSLSLGASLNAATSSHANTLIDLNADGLVDKARVWNGKIYASLNTGNGFTEEIVWSGVDELYESHNVSASINLVFTACIDLSIIPVRLCFNPGGTAGKGTSRDQKMLRDIDGDGYLDYLRSQDTDELTVSRSTIGRTNLLKTVYRPLGATISLDYARTGNTYKNPHNKWVLKEVTTTDGHSGDGADTMKQVFTYADGYYDRHERESYGFAWVSTADIDTANGNKVYRRNINHYINTNYYEKGLLDYTRTTDDANKTYVEKFNKYNTVDVFTQETIPDDQKKGDFHNAFSQLVQTQTLFYEGAQNAGQQNVQKFTYDRYGNVTEQEDLGDTSVASDDYKARVTYHQDLDNYILSVPEKIRIYDNSGKLLRHREATVDEKGSVTQVRIDTGKSTLTTDIVYDTYGNLSSIIYPANHKGQRYVLNYTLDDTVHTYTTAVNDSFGYRTTADYDYRFGVQLDQTDINNQHITTALDAKGRITAISGPLEAGATITHSYHPDAETPYAITRHYDEGRSDTLDTVTFVDGLMRVIQTKKDAAIDDDKDGVATDGVVVSGALRFDSFGRTVATYYPVSEGLGSKETFNAATDAIAPTSTIYDILNRKRVTTLPDGATMSNAYGFAQDRDGVTRFHTRSTDANGNVAENFKDVRERITAVLQHNPAAHQDDIWTSYSYNAVNELVQVKDDKGNLTQAIYDLAGRRTHINNPDTGWIESVYDGAGNVVAKITENLRAKGQAVSYVYDFNRLSNINYPNTTQNNVTYTYGNNAASHNAAGRITSITDASGERRFEYGKLGETTKETRTLFTYTGSSPKTYVTKYRYDTWNRLRELTYPDGEVVTHSYDSGGKLQNLQGKKGEYTYDYLKAMTYDKFGQRVFAKYANDTTMRYSYEPERRRLATLTAANVERTFMENSYSYDNMQNILGVSNSAAVQVDSSLFGGETSQSFDYDSLYQLTAASGKWTARQGHQHRYDLAMSYDTIGNIKTKKQLHERLPYEGDGWIAQKETSYDWRYSHTAKQPHAPTKIGNRLFSYDKNGNQTGWRNTKNASKRTIRWDEENRIQSVSDNGQTSYYVYDASGERSLKRTSQGETFYVNAYFVIREGSVASKHFFAGSQRIATKLVKQESQTINSTGDSDNIIYEKEQYYYHPDHLGSSSYVTDENGKVYEHLEYFPFGETFAHEHSNTQVTPYRFTGKELDEMTGLYYYGARYYDPRTSVWQSPDPILGEYMSGQTNGGVFNPKNLGLFTYTYNNPVIYTDPTGMCTEEGKDGCTIMSKEAAVNLKNPIDPVSPIEVNGYAMTDGKMDREADFSKVHLDDLGASIQKFAKDPGSSLNKAIEQASESGKPVDISISKFKASKGFKGDTPIAQKGAIGRFSVSIEGKVTAKKDGIWNLAGTVKGEADKQDYPYDKTRTNMASKLTSFGAWVQEKLGGENYDINFKGSQKIQVTNDYEQ